MSMTERMLKRVQRGGAETHAVLNTARFRRQRGASAIEYAIIVSVIAIAVFATAGTDSIATAFQGWIENVAAIINPETTET
jgi:Flp pilus assembly pilin Flp